MKFREVKTQLYSNENKVAKRNSWQTGKTIDKHTINSINESDRQSEDWIVLEKIND